MTREHDTHGRDALDALDLIDIKVSIQDTIKELSKFQKTRHLSITVTKLEEAVHRIEDEIMSS